MMVPEPCHKLSAQSSLRYLTQSCLRLVESLLPLIKMSLCLSATARLLSSYALNQSTSQAH